MLSLPRLTAPASSSRRAAVHSVGEVKYPGIRVPHEVGSPSRWQRSLSPTGTPWSGPRHRPAAASSSSARARRRAASSSSVMKAWIRSSCLRIRSRQRSTATTGESVRARIAEAMAIRLESAIGCRVLLALQGHDEACRLLGKGELPRQPLDHAGHACHLRLLRSLLGHGILLFAPTLADV